jgi:hypothetical protein
LRNYCPDFYDDFSNPASGWFVVDADWVRAEYLSGEYRILIKPADYSGFFSAPACTRQNYTAEVYARWAGNSGTGYGLVFGIVGQFERFYLFLVNTDLQQYTLLRYDGADAWTAIRPWTNSSAIHGGASQNQLGIIRDGSTIRLIVNGLWVDLFGDATISGATRAGVAVASYMDLPNADARFDSFRMAAYSGSTSTAPDAPDITSGLLPTQVYGAEGAPMPGNLARPPQRQDGE